VWSKFLKVFLVLMIFMGSLIAIYPNERVYAATIDITKVGKLTKVIRGIGEKIGINWTSTSLDAVIGYLAGQADFSAGGEPVLPFWQLFGTTPDTLPIDDGDTSRYLLKPSDFEKGVDLIKESKDVLVPSTVLPLYGKCNKPTSSDLYNLNVSGQNYIYSKVANTFYVATFAFIDGTFAYADSSSYVGKTALRGTNIGSWTTYHRFYTDNFFVMDYQGASSPTIDLNTFDSTYPHSILYLSTTDICDYTVTPTDVPDITNVNTTFFNSTTNNYNYYNNYPVTIVNEGTGGENIDVPVNPPLTPEETGNIFIPDTDGDGISDPTDITPGGETPTPDDTGIFAKLFPVLLIVKLFGVLGSCLMYLIRMFQFIMTIPGIDAIPIDNDAFVWFRSAQIVGIKIYDVVSSLAGVGLSFIVFRAIRRAYL
jgi:hypothetical protein